MAELVYAYVSEAYPVRVGSSNLPVPTMNEQKSIGVFDSGFDGLSILKEIIGDDVRIISEGAIVAKKLEDYLVRHVDLASRLSLQSHCIFYTTDTSDRFQKLGSQFFGKQIVPVHISLLVQKQLLL